MNMTLKKPMTRAGFNRLAEEHDHARNIERPKVLKAIQIAAAEGDRSENAEYIYGRKKLREMDKRLRYLNGLLTDVQIIDPEKLRGDRVSFGSTVVVEDEDGEEKRYTIVGEGEAEYADKSISWKSPVAKALQGKRVGETVLVRRPAGEIELTVVDLFFGARHYSETI